MGATIYESLLPGWPAGALGVAITSNGVLLRRGLSIERRAIALRWAISRLNLPNATSQSETYRPPLQSGTAHVEPGSSRDLDGQFKADLVK